MRRRRRDRSAAARTATGPRPTPRQLRHALRLIRLGVARPAPIPPAAHQVERRPVRRTTAVMMAQPTNRAPTTTRHQIMPNVPPLTPPTTAPPLYIPPQHPHRGPRRHKVDARVPEPLQRQHKRRHVLERHRHPARVHHAVHAVGARRDPRHQHGREEEQRALGVGPRRVVGLVGGAAAEAVRVAAAAAAGCGRGRGVGFGGAVGACGGDAGEGCAGARGGGAGADGRGGLGVG